MAGRRIASFIVLALLVSFLGLLSSGNQSHASYLIGGNDVGLNCLSGSCTPGDELKPGVNADYTSNFSLPGPGSNFSQNISFFPPDFELAPFVGNPPIPIGAMMGSLASDTSLGLLNTACDGLLQPLFPFQNATTDVTKTFVVNPSMSSIIADDCDPGNNLANHVDCYPDFENFIFDPDYLSPGPDGAYGTGDDINGPKPPLIPRARLSGYDNVAGNDVLLDFVVFNPGQLQAFAPPHPFSQIGPEFGYPTIVVLNNPLVPLSPGAITDFCTPLGTVSNLFGITQDNPATTTVDESGHEARRNPAAGTGLLGTDTHLFSYITVSFRDADSDNAEAGVDTCEGVAPGNTDDYRLTSGADLDMIDPSCDDGRNGPDVDGDGYQNSQDNCALVANGGSCFGPGCQWESELTAPLPADGGPRTDGMGDDCDLAPTEGNGHYHVKHMQWPVTIGDPVADADGDGWSDSYEALVGSPAGSNPVGDQDGDLVANAADNCPDIYNPLQTDGDADGIGDACETGFADLIVGDYDADTFLNAADNCPFWPNPLQTDTDADGIGDPCDPHITIDSSPYGRPEHYSLTYFPATTLYETFAATLTPGTPGQGVNEPCDDGIDNDGDTLCDTAGCTSPAGAALPPDPGCTPSGDADADGIPDGSDNCPGTYNPTQADYDKDGIGYACDPLPCPAPADDKFFDSDNDRFDDIDECYITTDPRDDCTNNPGVHDAWPFDNNIDGDISFSFDVMAYLGKIGACTPASCPRLDINADGDISFSFDVMMYAGQIGNVCV